MLAILAGDEALERDLHQKYPLLGEKSYLPWDKETPRTIAERVKTILDGVAANPPRAPK